MEKWPEGQNGGNHCHRIEYRKNKKEDIQRDLWDNIKRVNVCIVGVPEGEERDKGHEKTFE